MSSIRGLAAFLVLPMVCGFATAQMQPGFTLQPQQQAPAATALPPTASVLGATAPSAPDDRGVQVFRSRSDEVNVVFTVTDKHGKFIRDLKQSQFSILDNHRPPRQITNFAAETNLPLRVGLLIDASNSIRDRFLFEQQAASEFLQQIIRPATDKAFILAFNEIGEITQDFTGDPEKLAQGIKSIHPGGGTALWDAVFSACRDKLMKEKDDQPVRRAIVVVSDGDDNQSRVVRQQAIEMAQRAGVIIYTISTNLSNIHDDGDHNLKKLADETGGRAFAPSKLHDLTDAFHDIREELRSQYSVFYKPDAFEANGEFRPIEILAENKNLRVRAKKGYYVPRQ